MTGDASTPEAGLILTRSNYKLYFCHTKGALPIQSTRIGSYCSLELRSGLKLTRFSRGWPQSMQWGGFPPADHRTNHSVLYYHHHCRLFPLLRDTC